MRRLLFAVPLFLVGCSSQTPEEAEAAKYPQPKMMTEEQGRAFMAGQNDPRKGGAIPPPPPGEPSRR